MAVVLPFVALAEQPHDTAVLGCNGCGHLWVGVWPSRTAVRQFACPSCGIVGSAVIDPPRDANAPVEDRR